MLQELHEVELSDFSDDENEIVEDEQVQEEEEHKYEKEGIKKRKDVDYSLKNWITQPVFIIVVCLLSAWVALQ